MIRINLLPHREERRRAQKRHFSMLAFAFSIAAFAVGGFIWMVINGYIDNQNSRNEFLVKENARLSKEIEEITKLKEDIAALLARKQIIETLQTDRAQAVRLLDELVKQTPDGVYLRGVKQEGLKVNITGFAQSQARVSTLMRNIQGSPHLENPRLVEIKAATVQSRRLADFNLDFFLKRSRPEDPVKAAPGALPAEAKTPTKASAAKQG
jgi:type IV pilus assembly protein PilN